MALVLALPSTARAQLSISLGLDTAGGYDSNIYYRAGALPDDVVPQGGPYLGLSSRSALQADLGPGFLTLTHRADARQMLMTTTQDQETVLSQRVLLSYSPPTLWDIRLTVTAGLDQLFLRNFHRGGWISGVGMLTVSRALGDRARLSLAYILNATSYNACSSAASETTHRLSTHAAFRLFKGLELEPEYLFLVSNTDPGEYSSSAHRVGALARWDTPMLPLQIKGGYELMIYTMAQGRPGLGLDPSAMEGAPATPVEADGRRLDFVHTIRGSVSWRAKEWMNLGLRWSLLWGGSNLDGVEGYSRHQVIAAATFHWQGGGMKTEIPTLRLPPQTFQQEPTLRAEHLSRDASEVAVVGTFNGWDPEKDPMVQHRESWSAVLRPPPGLWQYMISVDGKIEPPQSCERWMADGFGGRNCVVFIGQAPAQHESEHPAVRSPHVLLGVEALAELPLQMGGRLWAELPGRIRLSSSLGAMPGFYLSAINTALVSAGALNSTASKILEATVEDALFWRVSLGWRPSSRRGGYVSIGYVMGLLDGFLPIHLLEVTAKSPPLSIPEKFRYQEGCSVETTLHMVYLEAGWHWAGSDGLSLRLALGAALTAGSSTTITAHGAVAKYQQVEELLAPSEAHLDEVFTSKLFMPTLTLAVGWQAGL